MGGEGLRTRPRLFRKGLRQHSRRSGPGSLAEDVEEGAGAHDVAGGNRLDQNLPRIFEISWCKEGKSGGNENQLIGLLLHRSYTNEIPANRSTAHYNL